MFGQNSIVPQGRYTGVTLVPGQNRAPPNWARRLTIFDLILSLSKPHPEGGAERRLEGWGQKRGPLARTSADAKQALRILAIAMALDGFSRAEAARLIPRRFG